MTAACGVTRATFLAPRLNMFTLTLIMDSMATPVPSTAGRNLRSRMKLAAAPSASTLPEDSVTTTLVTFALGVHVNVQGTE